MMNNEEVISTIWNKSVNVVKYDKMRWGMGILIK